MLPYKNKERYRWLANKIVLTVYAHIYISVNSENNCVNRKHSYLATSNTPILNEQTKMKQKTI